MSKTIDLLTDLISYNSSDKKTANETIQYCYDWLEKEQLQPEILTNDGYKMLLCEVGEGKHKLVLNGHVDVVSGKPEQFTPKIKNGKIYGRGSADMKSGVSAMMVAMSELQHIDLGDTTVQLQLVSDEEIGGKHCAAYLTEEGFLGDFVICGEATQLGIGFQAKGILQFDIILKGESAHSSRPWEGENAIAKALKLHDDILTLPFAQEATDIYKEPSINLAKINGGDVYNKVPDKCKVSYDIRYLPSQDYEEILSQIKGITNGDIQLHLVGPAVQNDVNHKYIKRLENTIKESMDSDNVAVFGQHGFADTRYFSRFDVPAIEFGPTGAEWHGDGEYVEIASVESYKDILVNFAEYFAK
ncbi:MULTISPECIES: M20 family metallopeptidase [Staphylococcus]|jgi:succinyl-diaminopimelate desuccinylase|uniref:M20 family metallopeptidase n=1 Tax=Staphylococcus TaxID=1279 RepID=UPI000D1EF385|nr:M20/M25/M40 family metallo-hydrolase [Staphylococcus gallinarum]MCD8822322.1 M20/M25/M40 family metallo-hydrolase [Staphylococcus gallinarum]PTK92819.1 succinyl-diaminopimelate desuccinylase [Staphylococcus gallinarum]PTL11276.1 succinyl-diaminopimelate desuccinylase [Staphylococcus gallinarum]RIO77634.1 M20 family peptidase [Staphylococcus gallinarum]